MGKRDRYRNAVDPEWQRWGQQSPRFPGVAECALLIRAGKARGSWADIIADELADNARDHLAEMIAEFHRSNDDDVALYIMMALEIACLPESVEFLMEVLQCGDSTCSLYARRTLAQTNTRESRAALFQASPAALHLRNAAEDKLTDPSDIHEL